MPDTGDQTTVIGADTYIKGEMTFERSARIVGKFDGKITAKGELHVGESATCKAEVQAGNVVVDGNVEGDMTADERVTLNAKSKMKGDLHATKLIVAEGAIYEGHISVGPNASKSPANPADKQKAQLDKPLPKP